MTKRLTILILALTMFTGMNAQGLKGVFNKVKKEITGGGDPSEEEVGFGLKEALNLGVAEAVDFLSAEDGYYETIYKVLLPEEAQQVTWHTGTGYFPVRTDISGNAELTAFWDENPNFVTAINQLESTKTTLDDGSPNYAVLGGRAGPSPAIRRLIVEAYSGVLDDGMTAQEALDVAAEKANQELADYNAFFE